MKLSITQVNHQQIYQPINELTINLWGISQPIRPIMNHFTNQLCHSSINPQSRQKELRLCQVIWLWKHMIWFCWPSLHPTPGNVGLQITEKMTLLFSIVLGREGGGRVEFFPFKLLLEVFLNNFFKIVGFSNIPCALQKHTIEVIKRICGSPRTGGVTITSLWTRLFFPFQHKFWVVEAPLMKSFSFWTRLINNYLKKQAFLLASSAHDAKLLNYEESGPCHSGLG